MKHQKTKFLTLSLASLLGALAIGGGTVLASADDTSTTPTPVTYSATDVFSATTATINTAGSYVSFGVKDTEGSVALKQRDLAWKWFTEKGTASYLNFKLSLADLNFEEITVSLETAAATANKDNKAVNTLTFTHEGGVVSVSRMAAESVGCTDSGHCTSACGSGGKIRRLCHYAFDLLQFWL